MWHLNYRLLIRVFSIRTKEVCLTLWETQFPAPKVPKRAFLPCQVSCLSLSLPAVG